MTFEVALQKFFLYYCQFVNVDLSVSLLDKKNKRYGRNIDILISFQDTFIFLLKTQNIDESAIQSDRKLAIDKLAKTVDLFAFPYLSKTKYIDCSDIKSTLTSNQYWIEKICNQTFLDIFQDYYVSYKDFIQHIKRIELNKEIRAKFELNEKDENILVQAILEINNAFAHIMVSILNNDNDELKNIEKAMNHVFRAALDHYKMLIRLIYLEKENITKQTTDKLEHLRFTEFRLLGKPIKNKIIHMPNGSAEDILTSYKEVFNSIMQKV